MGMFMKKVIILSFLLLLNACSGNNSKKENVSTDTDDLEFVVDTLADDNQPVESIKVEEEKIAQSEDIDEVIGSLENREPVMNPPPEPKFEDFTKESPAIIKTAEYRDYSSTDQVALQTNMEKYQMQQGDTLMMVAFKIYGDYRKWKELKKWNPQVKKFKAGTEISYYVPEKSFGWQPSGEAYMVKTGDTLQIISMDKYGTTRKWKRIYKHNEPLIRDPDLIFAGFTLYYLPERKLASEVK
jgi:nucleoid-associated protein YgaU